jgi:hypothetical protein
MVHTVFTQEMYHQWSKEGRLGTLGEKIKLEDEKTLRRAIADRTPVKVKMEEKDLEEEETMFLIENKSGKGPASIKLPKSKVSDFIVSLLQGGASLSDIKVYKPTEFKLSLEFGENG